jgi:hypothetical protein
MPGWAKAAKEAARIAAWWSRPLRGRAIFAVDFRWRIRPDADAIGEAERGYQVVVVDKTYPLLGIPVARVVVPPMRNCISIDTDTSTSDTVLLLSSGKVPCPDLGAFAQALFTVCRDLAEDVVRNGENPIAQEFDVFLHQTRVGVNFSDALNSLQDAWAAKISNWWWPPSRRPARPAVSMTK